jgi:hydrogenase nickel incorporation protein HypB
MKKEKINVMENLLSANESLASQLRGELKKDGIFFINLMSSPGSGKTRLIEKTAEKFEGKIGVIEGDIQTTLDAERIRKLGIETFQINTGPFGGDCHLEASWIKSAVENMNLNNIDILFVENIGNLVCPAEFDVGAHLNILIISVTEGEDKPLKYPLAFRVSQYCLISKIDLLPHLDFSIKMLKKNIKKINPSIKIIEYSAKTEEGLEKWIDFLKTKNT